MTTLTATHSTTPTRSFRAVLRRFLDAVLKIAARKDDRESFVWGRGL